MKPQFRNIEQLNALPSSENDDESCLMSSQLSSADYVAAAYLANLPGFSGFNQQLPETAVQGALECMYEVQQMSCSMTGLASASLAALSSSQAIFACLSIMKKYHQRKKQPRNGLLMCGDLPGVSNAAKQTGLDIKSITMGQLEQHLSSEIAAIILPVPNVDENKFITDALIRRIRELDILIYMEGSAQYFISDKVRMANYFVDLMSLDLGYLCEVEPGAFAVLTSESLGPYLPVPLVHKADRQYQLQTHVQNPQSIGSLSAAAGNVEAILRCFSIISLKGTTGIQQQALKAVVCSLYVMKKLSEAGLEKRCFCFQSSGRCEITLQNAESSIQLLESFEVAGLQLQGLSETDKMGFIINLCRLHYLTKKQLDLAIELIIKYLQ